MKFIFLFLFFVSVLNSQTVTPTPLLNVKSVAAYAAPTPAPITGDDKHMMISGMTADVWAYWAELWVLSICKVLDTFIAKIGVLGLAAIAVWQNLRARAVIKEVQERQDRQGERLDKVALAVPANGTSVTSTMANSTPKEVTIDSPQNVNVMGAEKVTVAPTSEQTDTPKT